MLNIQLAESVGFDNYRSALASCGVQGELSLDPDRESACDALLLPGGGDADPALYHQECLGSLKIDRELDHRQLALLERYKNAGKPVLGICRGHQIINIFFGGTLIQDLPGAERHRRKNGVDSIHPTTAAAGSYLAKLYGASFVTNSSHHQGIDIVGKGLIVLQHADDGVIEGIRHETLPILGVQWHPERMTGPFRRPEIADGSKLFRYFLSLIRSC